MTTPLKIEPKVAPDPNQPEKVVSSAEPEATTTTSTKDPTVQPTKTEAEKRLEQIVAAQQAIIKSNKESVDQMQQRLDALEKGPPASPEETSQAYYKDPIGETRKLIQAELKETIAPLQDMLKTSTSKSDYEKEKDKLRNDPHYKLLFERGEHYIDALMEKQEPTEQNLTLVLMGLLGAAQVGKVDIDLTPTTETTTTPESTTVINPPHMSPSAPTPPGLRKKDAGHSIDELDENERRLFGESGLKSVDDWFALKNADALDVVSMELPSEKAAKDKQGG
jgi:hypothetical protein